MKEVSLTMKPVCNCDYVFEDLVLKKIRPIPALSKFSTQFYSYEFDPEGCPNCGRKIGNITAPLLTETDGITIFAKKKEENHAE